MASDKTNVMRVLEQHKIAYTAHEYPHGKEAVDGVTVAQLLGQNVEQVFKTLVARGCRENRCQRQYFQCHTCPSGSRSAGKTQW